MITITSVVKTTEEVVSFMNPQFVENPLYHHALLDLSFETRVELHEKIEEFFKGAEITTSQWGDKSVRIIVPDHRSEKKCIYFDFKLTQS